MTRILLSSMIFLAYTFLVIFRSGSVECDDIGLTMAFYESQERASLLFLDVLVNLNHGRFFMLTSVLLLVRVLPAYQSQAAAVCTLRDKAAWTGVLNASQSLTIFTSQDTDFFRQSRKSERAAPSFNAARVSQLDAE